MTSDRTSWVDTLYGLLSESRRRFVLYELMERGEVTVDGVARRIVEHETGEHDDGSAKPLERSVPISLVHTHLPRLADCGLVEYDAATGTVAAGERFDEARETIARANAIEREHLERPKAVDYDRDSRT